MSETWLERSDARREGHTQLMGRVVDAQERGQRVPCVENPEGGWTSEDPIAQRRAAELCAVCPVLDACRGYVETHAESGGVWAGKARRSAARDRQIARLKQRRNEPTRNLAHE